MQIFVVVVMFLHIKKRLAQVQKSINCEALSPFSDRKEVFCLQTILFINVSQIRSARKSNNFSLRKWMHFTCFPCKCCLLSFENKSNFFSGSEIRQPRNIDPGFFGGDEKRGFPKEGKGKRRFPLNFFPSSGQIRLLRTGLARVLYVSRSKSELKVENTFVRSKERKTKNFLVLSPSFVLSPSG